ncbi:phosphomethylpyrimidine synthase ThiC [Candidatus Poribacteria bacterium]|nr:phosphomethylpyrimidine synthase ThiC [Candidatus Poribacteria bacterium]
MVNNALTTTERMDPPRWTQEIIEDVAVEEMVSPTLVEEGLRRGSIALLRNKDCSQYIGVGHGLTTKVNANVGTSIECPDYREVIKKAQIAARAGAHTLMDLSTVGFDGKLEFGKGISAVAEATGLPVGTVPIYEAARRGMIRSGNTQVNLDSQEMLDVVANQAAYGSVFMAIHVGLNKRTLEVWRKKPRNIVSKGGYITAEYMLTTGKENPFYERFDDLLDILKAYDVVLNIGSALRSGATRFNDEAQIAELESAGELAEIATSKGVQVVIEGPGHVPYAMIPEIVHLQRRLTGERPFFILGFMTTDAFTGWDHIVSAIGATEAVRHGVTWLCYITPAEHLRMPNDRDVKEGVVAARIAAHVGDCAKGQPKALAVEEAHNDKGCLDPRAKRQYCSICGQDFCPILRLHNLRQSSKMDLTFHVSDPSAAVPTPETKGQTPESIETAPHTA